MDDSLGLHTCGGLLLSRQGTLSSASHLENRLVEALLRSRRFLGLVTLCVALSGCITNRVLDADWATFCSYSYGGNSGMSAGGNEAALMLALTAAPCAIFAATIAVAIALDIATAPYQLWKGYMPCHLGRIHNRKEAAG